MENQGIRLINITGAFYIIVSARIVANTRSYGYFIELSLLGGEKIHMGYGYNSKDLEPVLETITQHVINHPDEALDLRKYFKAGDASGASYYGCTHAKI